MSYRCEIISGDDARELETLIEQKLNEPGRVLTSLSFVPNVFRDALAVIVVYEQHGEGLPHGRSGVECKACGGMGRRYYGSMPGPCNACHGYGRLP